MRILKVWDSEYPWDVRVEKVCAALTEMGHQVRLVARNRKRQPGREQLKECTLLRMTPWTWMGARLDAASQFPAFFNPRWATFILNSAKNLRADEILVRDLPLAPTAIWAGRRLGVPVILDMAENYPAMMRDLWTTGGKRFGDAFVRNPRIVEAVERWVLANVDHVLVVVEESRDRLASLGVPHDVITVVGNTPPLERLQEFGSLRKEHASSRSDGPGSTSMFRVAYLGIMEEPRGVGLAINAVKAARDAGVDVGLELIGDGRALSAFRRQAAELELEEDVISFHGFVPYGEALRRVASADAGLIPHYANESWETTIPNKLFDYMSLGIPVIASDVSPVARVIDETGSGVVFRDRDHGDLCKAIVNLEARADRAMMGSRGIAAIRTRYHWEADANRLQTAIRMVASRK